MLSISPRLRVCALASGSLLNMSCLARVYNSAVKNEENKIQIKTALKSNDLINLASQNLQTTEKLTKFFYRQTELDISDADFDLKWNMALEAGALKFLRSFVASYYKDLKIVSGAGPVGVCFGDAHIENFGFVVFADGPHFVYNDFDDSGYCPVGLDILRYLTSINLYEKESPDSFEKIAQEYVNVLSGKNAPQELNSSFVFNPEKIREKKVFKFIENERFIDSPEFSKVPENLKLEIAKALKNNPDMQKVDMKDVVATKKEAGGSAGLEKYLIYVSDASGTKREIFECKPLIEPGTAAGEWKTLPNNRIVFLQNEIWKNLKPIDYFEVKINDLNYVIRSRTTGSIDLNSLNSEERMDLYKSQVGIIATLHKKTWQSSDTLEKWLIQNTQFMAERYHDIIKQVSK